jgi:two-component system response regulator (stage 0 sporulation protein A)
MSVLTRQAGKARTRVLLVDGHKDFVRAAESFLQRQPELEVVGIVCQGEEPLARAEKVRPCVILVDLETPELLGMGMICRLRKALPRVAIIALSMSGDTAYREAALRAGADELVCKTELMKDLLPAIARVTSFGRR